MVRRSWLCSLYFSQRTALDVSGISMGLEFENVSYVLTGGLLICHFLICVIILCRVPNCVRTCGRGAWRDDPEAEGAKWAAA